MNSILRVAYTARQIERAEAAAACDRDRRAAAAAELARLGPIRARERRDLVLRLVAGTGALSEQAMAALMDAQSQQFQGRAAA